MIAVLLVEFSSGPDLCIGENYFVRIVIIQMSLHPFKNLGNYNIFVQFRAEAKQNF